MLSFQGSGCMRPGTFISSSFCVAVFSIGLSGCALPPAMGAMEHLRGPSSLASNQSFSGPAGMFPADEWWKKFSDPALNALIAEGLENSPTMARAAARMRAARAMMEESRSATLPHLDVSATLSEERVSQNQFIPPQFIPDGLLSEGRLGGSLSFDIDLWGKNRAALAAATSDARAAEVDAAQARLMVSSSIAQSYFDLARLSALRNVMQDALLISREALALSEQRVSQGVETQVVSRQAEARLSRVQGELLALDEAIALQRNALAALAGTGPDRGLAIDLPLLPDGAEMMIPPNLGVDLLGRRPDIVAARLRSEAQAARIKVASANFYPNLRLSAVGGLQSIGLDTLFGGSSAFTTFGPALSLPIFDGGALRARYRGARAGYAQAVAEYDATLVAALQEVADVLSRKRLIGERLASAKAAVAAGEDASALVSLRYKGGLASRLQVLGAREAEISARGQLVTLRALDVMLDIAMIRALGGGFGVASSQSSEGGK
jgi:NodT family efflux transporter outer membrane factor (OMF) lipoprotein